MPRKRLLAIVATVGVVLAGAAAALLPITASEAAVACATPYDNSTVYTGGAVVSYHSHNWTAKWWTQYEAPSTGGSGVWSDNGACDGGSGGGGGACDYPNWVAGQNYTTGAIVRYTNGLYYQATHDNPGYDPTISTWYWSPYSCSGGGGGNTGGFVVSEAQFNSMFPGRNSFYTYQGLVAALAKYPSFATTGGDTVAKQEAAAFLANVGHETGGLVYIDEINQANWPTYCDWSQPYGCPAGQSAYHGRGPIQLSWNFNYYAAGNALGVDLLDNPNLVATDAAISWETGIWYWMTGTGNAGTTSHNAMVNGQGFGTTIRAINGIECNGGNTAEMQDRVNLYTRFAGILGVPTGGNLTC
ncbi:glycoside hydrolase family 19 protein [Actinoplanes subtropicus]|uniref:glycoside hydrolase family 19 protein n=1 Tax=Actinoplanes subtropicus TaxID=543632 RepID=UPI0004C4160B|nr:glycoside hydrolase family 19 protein [Actinoplanes subtropicus]